jgi:DNA-binding Xre family transcriptional regulator
LLFTSLIHILLIMLMIDRNKLNEAMSLAEINSYRELAKRAGTYPALISNMLTGRYSPTLRTVGRLCSALGCRPESIIGYHFDGVDAPV